MVVVVVVDVVVVVLVVDVVEEVVQQIFVDISLQFFPEGRCFLNTSEFGMITPESV